MSDQAPIGLNKTGAHMSRSDVRAMEDVAVAEGFAPEGDTSEMAHMRSQSVHEAEPIGSVPLPGTLRGVVTTGLNKLSGRNPEVLIDKLGERLAFERTGARLYDAMIMKCIALQNAGETVPIAELERLRAEETEHFLLLTEAITSLGADPTAQTPSADVAAVTSMGVLQAISDPRTNLAQSMNALLSAELVDYAGWELLIQLTEQMGQDEWAGRFRHALAQEAEHRVMVQGWLQSMVLAEAT
jgi:ferritin-like protein